MVTAVEKSSNATMVLAAVGVGSFASSVNGSIVNTVLPVMTRELGARVSTIEWVLTVYLLVVSGLLLTVGRWGDLHGYRRTYATGLGIFTVSSALCGTALNAPMLIAFRAVQAVGAAAMFASAPAILTSHFPQGRRGQALGLQAMMTYLGLTAGPLLGGWLATELTWRAVFVFSVPLGALALYLCLRYVPADGQGSGRRSFDSVGAALFLAALASLLLALNRGHAWGWGSAGLLGLFALSFVSMAAFVRWEARSPDPMLDLSLFRNRVFTSSTISALLNYVSVFSITFILPFYLIRGRGMTPAEAGVVLTAQPVTMAISAPLSGALADRIGARGPATLGMLLLALGLFLLSRLGPATPLWYVAGALSLAGLGTGVFISPNNSALMDAAPRGRQGIAAGVMATARNVGMALGIGMAGAIFTTALGSHADPGLSPGLFAGVRAGFLAASATAALGAVTSIVKNPPRPLEPDPPASVM